MVAQTQAQSNGMIELMANGHLQVLLVSAVHRCEALSFSWKMFLVRNALTDECGPTSLHLCINGRRRGLDALETGNLSIRKGICIFNLLSNLFRSKYIYL